jgi:SAM-dependent methyltransferase
MSDEGAETLGLKTRVALQERLGTHLQDWWIWLFNRMALPPECRVLEVAAGSGTLWVRNAARMRAGWHLTLSDASPAMVREARAAAAAIRAGGAGLAALVADVAAIPGPDGRWDAVLANGVFDYLTPSARATAFVEIRRVLAPEGRLYTVTGGRGHLSELEDLVRPFVPEADYGGDPEAFGLENGAAQMAPWFADITLARYDEDLVFREPEPLLQYLLSETQVRDRLDAAARTALTQHVKQVLAEQGELRATQHKGLFQARVGQ